MQQRGTPYTNGGDSEPMSPFSGSDQGEAGGLRDQACSRPSRRGRGRRQSLGSRGSSARGRAGAACRFRRDCGRGGRGRRGIGRGTLGGGGPSGPGAGELGAIRVEGRRVGEGPDEPGGLAVPRVEGTQEGGRARALVLERGQVRAAFRPAPGELVLLSAARLVRPPSLRPRPPSPCAARSSFRRAGQVC